MEHVNAEILRAIADGKKVQYREHHSPSGWKFFHNDDSSICWHLLEGGAIDWRIAPETIKIGKYEVPEPCRVTPEVGFKFWVLTPFGGAAFFIWDGSKPCYDALKGGFVHLTEKAAKQRYEAIKGLLATKKKCYGTHSR